jgi:hypothetical protein
LVWCKNRDSANRHALFDAVRGVTNRIRSDGTDAEAADPDTLTSFNSDGFTVGADAEQYGVNGSTNSFVSWNWKAGSSNTAISASGSGDGAINACTHRANTTSKFSIITWTGANDQISSGEHTKITHGLGTKPDFLIIKDLDGAQNWCVMRGTDDDDHLRLDTTAALDTSLPTGDQTSSDTTHFVVGDETMVNYNIRDFIGYVWTSVQGFSKFGSYTGNGNADGAFIYTGFRPAFLIVKKTSGADNWTMADNKRPGYNSSQDSLYPNLNNAEVTTTNWVDFYSNGFKLLRTDGAENGSGSTYIYMAFAEAPFVNSNGVPGNAR